MTVYDMVRSVFFQRFQWGRYRYTLCPFQENFRSITHGDGEFFVLFLAFMLKG